MYHNQSYYFIFLWSNECSIKSDIQYFSSSYNTYSADYNLHEISLNNTEI